MKKLLLLLIGAVVGMAVHADVTIRFYNTGNWSQVNCWAWTTGQAGGEWLSANGYDLSDTDKKWPGPAMTKQGDKNCYEITFKNAPEKIIFSPNGDGSKQVQVSYSAGNFYNASGVVNVGEKYKVGSSIDGWSKHPMTFDAAANAVVYTYTAVQSVAGDDRMLEMWIDGKKFTSTQNAKVFNGVTTTYLMQELDDKQIKIAKGYAGDILCSFNLDNYELTLSNPNGQTAGSRLHIHTMALIENQNIFPFDLENGSNPYEVTINVPAPLAQDVPLCVHLRQDGGEYTAYSAEFEYEAESEEGTNDKTRKYLPMAGKIATAALGIVGDQADYIVLPKGLKGAIKIAVTTAEDYTPTEVSVSGGEMGTMPYTYKLWENFKDGGALEQTMDFTPHTGHFDVEYTFDGTEKGHLFKVERYLDGQSVTGRRWGIARHSATYVPNAAGVTYSPLSANGTDNPVLPEGLKGTVTISVYVDKDGVPEKFIIRGGHFGDEPDAYTIYYYDTTPDHSKSNPYVHIWRTEAGSADIPYQQWGNGYAAEEKMEATGQYVKSGSNYYPLFKYTFTWHMIPSMLSIHEGSTMYVNNTRFENGGYYHYGSTAADATRPSELVSGVTFYMHWKEDWLSLSQLDNNTKKPVHAPKCYLADTEFDAIDNQANYWKVWNDGKTMEVIDDFVPVVSTDPNMIVAQDEQMTVTEKYQIWKCTFSPEELQGKKNVYFSIMGNDGHPWVYASRQADLEQESDFTKYIYSTQQDGKGRYAAQAFLTYDQFSTLDAQGRPNIYLIGDNKGAIALPASWSLRDPGVFASEQGCFYIPLDISTEADAKFKMSWISVNDAITLNGINDGTDGKYAKDGYRQWATFDLGIIGVNDDKSIYPAGYDGVDITYEGNDRKASFKPNHSIAFLNYNQFDWFVSKDVLHGDDFNTGKAYIVVDPHSTCRTVTLIPYDPNPQIGITSTASGKKTLTKEEAEAFHGNHSHHLSGAAHNGHIYMDRVNYISGDITLTKSNPNLLNWFDLMYSIYMDGEEVLSLPNPADKLHMDYMPMSSSNKVGIRAEYKNQTTKLTFHSKLGSGEFSAPDMKFPQPLEEYVTATKVVDPGTATNPEMFGRMGLMIEKIQFDVEEDTELNYYADFTFDLGDRAEIIHGTHRIKTYYDVYAAELALEGWEFLPTDNDYDFATGKHDWSTKIKEGKQPSVYLTNTGDNMVEGDDVHGKLYAVYPFYYQLTPTLSGSGAPRKAATDPTNTYNVVYIVKEAPVTAKVGSGVVSGVEEVAVDGDLTGAEAEYFTLSGVRVYGDPTPGIYICRKGNVVTKVIVK